MKIFAASALLFLSLVCHVCGAAGGVTAPGVSGSGSGFKPLYEVFDDFERNIPFNRGLIGRADSGQTWGNRGNSTNGVMTTTGLNGRRIAYGSNAPGAFYMWQSNSSGFAPKYWTKFGGRISLEHTGRSSGLVDGIGMIIGDTHNFTGNFLHIGINLNVFYVERSLSGSYFIYSGTPATYLDPAGGNSNRIYDFSVTIVSNTLTARLGPWKYSCTADDLYLYAAKPVALWEINGSATNDVRTYWESVFAGYADESDVGAVLNPVNWYGMTNWAGTGGGSTNFTILADKKYQTINATGPVSLTASMNYLTLANVAQEWSLWIPNTSGADRTLQFVSTTNRWRFLGPTGLTNAPSLLTNNTATLLKGIQQGTNVFVDYEFFTLP